MVRNRYIDDALFPMCGPHIVKHKNLNSYPNMSLHDFFSTISIQGKDSIMHYV